MGTFTYTVRSLRVVQVQLLLFYAQLYLLLVRGSFTQLVALTNIRKFKRTPITWSIDHVAFGLSFTTPVQDEHVLFLYKLFNESIRLEDNSATVWVYVKPKCWDEFISLNKRYDELRRRLDLLRRSSFIIDREGDNV